MYLRLVFVFLLFMAWTPAARADLTPGTQSNSVLMPDPHAGPAPIPSAHPGSPGNRQNPPDEVTLEINMVQIILNDEHRGGVDWAAIVSDFHTAPLRKEDDPLWDDKKFRLSFGTVSEDDYSVLLDALDMAGQMSQTPQLPVKVIAGTPASVSFDKQNIHVDLQLQRLN